MARSVYVETTAASYFTARPSRDLLIAGHQEATRELWPKFASEYKPYVSALGYEEAGRGDPDQAQMRLAALESFPMLDTDDDARSLAEKILAGGGIPVEHPEDALHIAVAAVNGVDILVTWNFAHLNKTRSRAFWLGGLLRKRDFVSRNRSPEELLGSEK